MDLDLRVVCLGDKEFKALVDKLVAYAKAEHGVKKDKWISTEEAMAMLRITSKNTLQKYRDEGKLRCAELSPRSFLYDVDSITAFIESKAGDTF